MEYSQICVEYNFYIFYLQQCIFGMIHFTVNNNIFDCQLCLLHFSLQKFSLMYQSFQNVCSFLIFTKYQQTICLNGKQPFCSNLAHRQFQSAPIIKLIDIYHQMLRKFDYLQDKQQSQSYNFVQEQSQTSIQFDTILLPSHQSNRRRYRVMHATIQTPEILRSRPLKTRAHLSHHHFSKESEEEENDKLQHTKNNLIYHKVMDKYKEQFYRIKIREGIKQITNHQHLSLIPSLSNKHSSLYSEFQACSLERKLKKRLKLGRKSDSRPKRKEAATIQAKTSVRQIREGLEKRINQINKIVNEDAQSINLKIQDPMNQMQRIRIITENKPKNVKMTANPGNSNIEDNIFEVRQLMRRYLNRQ